MSKKNKRTSRKSQGIRNTDAEALNSTIADTAAADSSSEPESAGEGASSRIVDMSWAAEYIDDDWENKYGGAGNYDTRVVVPSSRKSEKSGNGPIDLMADSVSMVGKGESNVADDVAEDICDKVLTPGEDVPDSLLAATQTYMGRDSLGNPVFGTDAVKPDDDTVMNAVSQLDTDDDWDGMAKIRDAVTDKTIVSLDDAVAVRKAASELDIDADLDDIVKIRDAVTDKTIVSVTEARSVRDAAAALNIDDDFSDMVKIRDAVTDKTIVSVTEARSVRDAAAALDIDDDFSDDVKIRDALTDKTIVSVSMANEVRSAAAAAEKAVPFVDNVPESASRSAKVSDFNLDDLDDLEMSDNSETDEIDETRVFSVPEQKELKKKTIEKSQPVKAQKQKKQEQQKRANRRRSDESYSDRASDRYNDFFENYSDEDYDDRRNRQRRRDSRYYDDRRYDYDYDYDDRRRGRRNEPRRREQYDDYYEYRKSPLRFIPLVLVIAICVFVFIAARQICYDVPVNQYDYSKFSYTITADSDDASVARDLAEMGVIDNELIFRIRCKLYSADFVEGTYELSPCYSTEKIVNILSGYEYGESD